LVVNILIGIALLFIAVAIPVQLKDSPWTTIAWVTLGTALVWLSFRFKMEVFRMSAYPILAAVVFRLVFFDINLDTRSFVPVMNERFLAYIISILAMYFISYNVRQNREILSEWEKNTFHIYPLLLIAAHLFSIILLSTETWGYCSRQILEAGSSSDTRFMVSGLRSARNRPIS